MWHLLSKSAQRINTECLSDFGSAQWCAFALAALRYALVCAKRLRLLIFACTWHPSCDILAAEDNRSNSWHGRLICVRIF